MCVSRGCECEREREEGMSQVLVFCFTCILGLRLPDPLPSDSSLTHESTFLGTSRRTLG